MIVTFTWDEIMKDLTEEEILEIERARDMPIVYDDDCPEMTEEMAAAFAEQRRLKPYVPTGKEPEDVKKMLGLP